MGSCNRQLEPQKCVPLGVEVMAPNDMLWTYPGGRLVIGVRLFSPLAAGWTSLQGVDVDDFESRILPRVEAW